VWVIWVTVGLPWLPVSMVTVELGVCWHHTPISVVITIWQHTLDCNWVRDRLVWVIWVTAGLPWLPVFMVTVELGVCWHHTPISIVITIWQHTLDYNWVPDRLVWVIWVTAGLPWLPVSMVMVELGVCWHHTPISIVITIWQHTLACNWVRGFTVPTHLGLN